MSDYLWDKTGARDAEVERLENLLGQLRHRPQPFTPPDELTAARAHNAASPNFQDAETARTPSGTHALPARRHIRASWLAVAAVLLLAFVALALALLRTGTTGGQPPAQAGGENSRQGQPQQVAGYQPQTVGRQTDTPPDQPVTSPKQVDVAQSRDTVTTADGSEKRDAPQVVKAVAKENRKEGQIAPKERQPVFVAGREPKQSPRAIADNGSGEVARATRPSSPNDLSLAKRLAAKEQLMYALRLTSSKLSEVRAKTLGLGDAKQGFVEGNRVK
jgi:hypothetical protein